MSLTGKIPDGSLFISSANVLILHVRSRRLSRKQDIMLSVAAIHALFSLPIVDRGVTLK
jgi:hypothetical protein